MTVSIAIAVILIADIAILAGLAYVMSRASKLRAHMPSSSALAPEAVRPAHRVAGRHPQRPSGELATAVGS
jgi:hypothetical protein